MTNTKTRPEDIWLYWPIHFWISAALLGTGTLWAFFTDANTSPAGTDGWFQTNRAIAEFLKTFGPWAFGASTIRTSYELRKTKREKDQFDKEAISALRKDLTREILIATRKSLLHNGIKEESDHKHRLTVFVPNAECTELVIYARSCQMTMESDRTWKIGESIDDCQGVAGQAYFQRNPVIVPKTGTTLPDFSGPTPPSRADIEKMAEATYVSPRIGTPKGQFRMRGGEEQRAEGRACR